MPKASKATASEHVQVEGYEGHLEKLEGGYTVAFERYTADADLTGRSERCRRHPRPPRRSMFRWRATRGTWRSWRAATRSRSSATPPTPTSRRSSPDCRMIAARLR